MMLQVDPWGSLDGSGAVDVYRVALRRFLVDGRLTAEEEFAPARTATHGALTPERALLHAAEEMGLPLARATAILDEMERVVGGGGR